MYFLLAVKRPQVIDGEQKYHGSTWVDTALCVEGSPARQWGLSTSPGTYKLARTRRRDQCGQTPQVLVGCPRTTGAAGRAPCAQTHPEAEPGCCPVCPQPLLPPWCLAYCLCVPSLPHTRCARVHFTRLWLPQRRAPSKTEARYLPPSIKCLCGRHLVGQT